LGKSNFFSGERPPLWLDKPVPTPHFWGLPLPIPRHRRRCKLAFGTSSKLYITVLSGAGTPFSSKHTISSGKVVCIHHAAQQPCVVRSTEGLVRVRAAGRARPADVRPLLLLLLICGGRRCRR